jgi:hypothetical protein
VADASSSDLAKAAHVSVAGLTPGDFVPAGGTSVNAGPYTWINGRSGKCLDQDYSGGVPHSDVLAWPCNGASNQRWLLL